MEESHLTNEIFPKHFISNINPTPLALFIMCTHFISLRALITMYKLFTYLFTVCPLPPPKV